MHDIQRRARQEDETNRTAGNLQKVLILLEKVSAMSFGCTCELKKRSSGSRTRMFAVLAHQNKANGPGLQDRCRKRVPLEQSEPDFTSKLGWLSIAAQLQTANWVQWLNNSGLYGKRMRVQNAPLWFDKSTVKHSSAFWFSCQLCCLAWRQQRNPLWCKDSFHTFFQRRSVFCWKHPPGRNFYFSQGRMLEATSPLYSEALLSQWDIVPMGTNWKCSLMKVYVCMQLQPSLKGFWYFCFEVDL